MAARTVAEAIARVRTHYLNDPNSRKWTDDTPIKQQLEVALQTCASDYDSNGGDSLRLALDTTSSAGVIDLSSANIFSIKKVMVQTTTRWSPVLGINPEQMENPDTEDRTIRIIHLPKLVVSATTTHPLVGDPGTPANALDTWATFDEWVCLCAALLLLPFDAESRPDIERNEQMLRDKVMNRETRPRSGRLPRNNRLYPRLRWHYLDDEITFSWKMGA